MRTKTSLNVIGVGARTSLGCNLASSAAAARARLTAFADHPFMVDRTGQPMVVAGDQELEPGLPLDGRLLELATAAASETLAVIAGKEFERKMQTMLFLALPEADRAGDPEGCDKIVEAIADECAARTKFMGARSLKFGHAAGVAAVNAAARAFQEGFKGAALVLGVDSWLAALALENLDETGRLHSPTNPFGFVPGEAAAGMLIMAERFVAKEASRAKLLSTGWSNEAVLGPHEPRLGLALTSAARKSLRSVDIQEERLRTVVADLNGIPERADEVGYTLVRISDRLAPDLQTITPAEWFGDVGAATIPLAVGLGVMAADKGYLPEGLSLLLAQSLGTERGAMLADFWGVVSR